MEIVDYEKVMDGFKVRVTNEFLELGKQDNDLARAVEAADRAIKIAEMGIMALKHCSLLLVQGDPKADNHPDGCVCSVLGAVMIGMVPYLMGAEIGPGDGLRASLDDLDIAPLVGNSILFLRHLQELGIAVLPSVKCWAVQE